MNNRIVKLTVKKVTDEGTREGHYALLGVDIFTSLGAIHNINSWFTPSLLSLT